MITRNLKVGDRFLYKSTDLTFEAVCITSENGCYRERITKTGNSGWNPGTIISSHQSENEVITLLNSETELKNFKFKSKNRKNMETTIKKL